MSGTVAGGKMAAKKNLENDPGFYSRIGRKGGKVGRTGGFASEVIGDDGLTGRQRASEVGRIGGRRSRRRR